MFVCSSELQLVLSRITGALSPPWVLFMLFLSHPKIVSILGLSIHPFYPNPQLCLQKVLDGA